MGIARPSPTDERVLFCANLAMDVAFTLFGNSRAATLVTTGRVVVACKETEVRRIGEKTLHRL